MIAAPASRVGRPRVVEDDVVFRAMTDAIVRVGLSRLSVNELAVDLGITPAALRQRFGSKAELIHAFHHWSTEQMRSVLDEAERAGGSPLETLEIVVRTSAPMIDSPERLMNALSMLTDPAADETSRGQIADRLAISAERLSRLIRRAVAAGELEGADAEAVAARLQEAHIGACVVWALQHEAADSLAERMRSVTDAALAPYRPKNET
jgi:AcrR family transcriptional regulator